MQPNHWEEQSLYLFFFSVLCSDPWSWPSEMCIITINYPKLLCHNNYWIAYVWIEMHCAHIYKEKNDNFGLTNIQREWKWCSCCKNSPWNTHALETKHTQASVFNTHGVKMHFPPMLPRTNRMWTSFEYSCALLSTPVTFHTSKKQTKTQNGSLSL